MGILEEPILDEQKVTIPQGGTMVLYTDGVMDARHPNGESFGMKRLIQELGDFRDGSAQDQCDRLWQRLSSFQSDNAQEDDVTLVIIKSTS